MRAPDPLVALVCGQCRHLPACWPQVGHDHPACTSWRVVTFPLIADLSWRQIGVAAVWLDAESALGRYLPPTRESVAEIAVWLDERLEAGDLELAHPAVADFYLDLGNA